MEIKAAVAATLIGLFPAASWADSSSGAAFLGVTPSARAYALGMGNGITALGAEAIGSNPANLGLLPQRFSFFSSYARLFEGANHQHLAAAFAPQSPLGALDAFGLSVTRLSAGGFETADAAGNRTGGTFSASDLAVSLSASALVSDGLRLGLTGKAIQSQIAGYRSGLAPAADLGLSYTLASTRKPVTLGLSVTNLGRGIRFLDQTDPLPTALNLGVALPLGPLLGLVEINRRLYQQETRASVGLEYNFGAVSFRGGYLAQRGSGNLAARDQKGGLLLGSMSAGVGIKLGAARLDYAMSQQAADFGTTQRVALSMQWGSRGRWSSRQGVGGQTQEWKRDLDRSDWVLQPMGSY